MDYEVFWIDMNGMEYSTTVRDVTELKITENGELIMEGSRNDASSPDRLITLSTTGTAFAAASGHWTRIEWIEPREEIQL